MRSLWNSTCWSSVRHPYLSWICYISWQGYLLPARREVGCFQLHLIYALAQVFILSSFQFSWLSLSQRFFFFSIKSQLNFTVRSIEGVAPEWAVATEEMGAEHWEHSCCLQTGRGSGCSENVAAQTQQCSLCWCLAASPPELALHLCRAAGSILKMPNGDYCELLFVFTGVKLFRVLKDIFPDRSWGVTGTSTLTPSRVSWDGLCWVGKDHTGPTTLLKQGQTRTHDTGLCPQGLWISPERETPHPSGQRVPVVGSSPK